MNERPDMTRRRFLLLSAACGAGLVSRALLPDAWRTVLGRPPTSAERLLDTLPNRTSARVVGAAYLEMLPASVSTDALVDAIVAGIDGGARALRSTRQELRGLLARRVQQDFAEDAIVCLRGWIVSRTEARLCALAALT